MDVKQHLEKDTSRTDVFQRWTGSTKLDNFIDLIFQQVKNVRASDYTDYFKLQASV